MLFAVLKGKKTRFFLNAQLFNNNKAVPLPNTVNNDFLFCCLGLVPTDQ